MDDSFLTKLEACRTYMYLGFKMLKSILDLRQDKVNDLGTDNVIY